MKRATFYLTLRCVMRRSSGQGGGSSCRQRRRQLVVQLLLDHQRTPAGSGGLLAALRKELQGLGLGALTRRAAGAGVDPDAIEVAMDSDDGSQSAALIELILGAHTPERLPSRD